jgi:hypothetical protein
VVVFLDDVQWADPAEHLLTRHLLLEGTRALTVVVSRREDAGGGDDALRATATLVERRGLLDRVVLAGLERAEVAQLVAAARGAHDDVLAYRLWEGTGGNPLFVTELLDAAHELGSTRALPSSLREAIAQRVESLSEGARSMLVAAAVLGQRVDGGVLADVLERGRGEVAVSLDEVTAKRLLAPTAQPGVYEFGHAIVRDAVYEAIPAARRAGLHRRAGEMIEARYQAGTIEVLPELAWHWDAAGAFGDAAKAVEYHRLAGEDADRRLAYDQAAAHFRRSLELLDERAVPHADAARIEVLLALAAAENRAGDVRSGKRACAEAAVLARRARRADLFARAALAFGGVLPTGAEADDADAPEYLRQALAVLPPDDPLVASVASRLAQYEYWTMDRGERRALCRRAGEVARATGNELLLAEVLVHEAWALNCPDEIEARFELATGIEEVARRLGDLELVVQAGKCRLHALLELGDFDAACRLADRLARTARQLELPEFRRLAIAFDAMRAGAQGHFDVAEELAGEAREVLRRRGQALHAAAAWTAQVFPWRWLRGELAQMTGPVRRAIDGGLDQPSWIAMLAWGLAATGDHEEARERLDDLRVRRFVEAEQHFDWRVVLTAAIHTAVALRADEELELAAGALAPYAERSCVMGQVQFLGAAGHHLGVAAAVLGDHEAAIEHLGVALGRHRRMRASPFVALTAAELAYVLALRGGPAAGAEAADLADEAAGLAARFGVPAATARAVEARAILAGRSD